MAAIVYGGSPRHHSGRMTGSHHHHSSSTTHHYTGSANVTSPSAYSHHHPSAASNNPIIMPPASYLSGSSLTHAATLPPPQFSGGGSPLGTTQQTIHHHYQHTSVMYSVGRHHKRKSAVELLAESKPFYVKSETVLDRHQQLNFRGVVNSGVGTGVGVGVSVGGGTGVGGGALMGGVGASGNVPVAIVGGGAGDRISNMNTSGCIMSPSRTHSVGGMHHHHHSQQRQDTLHQSHQQHPAHHRPANRRSASSSSDLLQTKLRKLLNTDSKEGPMPPMPGDRYKNSDPQKYDTFSKFQGAKYNQELSVHASNDQSDLSVMFPSAFLSPQSLPPHPASDEDIYSYEAETNEPLVLTEDYRAISPPAEYAAVESSPDKEQNSRYQRSYSHSHDTTSDEHDYSSPSYNINSHKSLPDLHSQISRHSPHSEVLSCCSRGNRSNKSGGSSLNRDSGGSSGHYTHRSEPCCKQRVEREANKMSICVNQVDYRRDSGSSTQHSGNSYYTYGMGSSKYTDCPECRLKYQKDSECLLNFTTPEVPEAFQDDYAPEQTRPMTRFYEDSRYTSQRKMYPPPPTHHQLPPIPHKQTHSPTIRTPTDDVGCLKEPEVSPPPTGFKRQKCLRFKHRNRYSTSNDRTSQRSGGSGGCTTAAAYGPPDRESDEDRKPILRSKSDISDRYYNRGSPMTEQPMSGGKNSNGMEKIRRAESMSQLEKFFDRLGLNEEKFEEIYSPPKRRYSTDNDSDQSGSVFFSDVSTVDSTRLPDSTETQPQTTQPYRPTEPPSIVERNARIIKWLCNCRKLQLT